MGCQELIKVRGYQVAPAELESHLLEHPRVTDAAVIGISKNNDEYPRAYIVLEANSKADAAAAEDILEDHSDKFDFGRFVSDVIPNLLTLHGACKIAQQPVPFSYLQFTDTPFLAGRAFVLASRLASVLPAQLLQQYLSAAASVLESSGGVVIKISAVKAIRKSVHSYVDAA